MRYSQCFPISLPDWSCLLRNILRTVLNYKGTPHVHCHSPFLRLILTVSHMSYSLNSWSLIYTPFRNLDSGSHKDYIGIHTYIQADSGVVVGELKAALVAGKIVLWQFPKVGGPNVDTKIL